jgi:phosphonopyruvate decarboxylase
MINPKRFCSQLKNLGFQIATGVPCSFFSSLIQEMEETSDIKYVNAVNEGDALAIACGAFLGSKKSCLLIQNSGLGNAINPLTSLALTFHIPVLLFISWRGDPEAALDEPQHQLMGRITSSMLELMGITWKILPSDEEEAYVMLIKLTEQMEQSSKPVAILVKKGTFEKVKNEEIKRCYQRRIPFSSKHEDILENLPELHRDEVLYTIQNSIYSEDLIFATTGYTARALYAIKDVPNQFYMVGSMGCVSSLGLGMALARPERRVIVIDGDGALLMRAGALAAIGAECPSNYLHILLNNYSYESTGGQRTVAENVNFTRLALSTGYKKVKRINSLSELNETMKEKQSDLTFIEISTSKSQESKLPRPEEASSKIASRFRENIIGEVYELCN